MGKGAKQEGPVMKGVGHAVAEAAYLSSDVCFLFPVLPDHPFGEELLHMEEAGHKNRHGKPCKVHKLHTYPSALDVTNKAAPGGMVGVVTLSQGLASMAINIRAAVQHRRAMVIHVAGVDVGENFELHSNTRTAYELMDAGAGLVVSANALDCYGAAIYSYMLAQQLQAPVIHLVDGPLALAARSSAALSWDLVASMAESMHRAYVPSSRGGMQMDVGDFHAFAYHGDRAPRSVFVAVGPAVQSAKRAVDSGHGLGLLHVEVLEPWSDQDFLARLPASTEFVVVLDYANAAKALHQRVRRAVAGSAQLRAVGALSVEYETAEDIDSARLLQLAASQGRGQEYGAVALQDIEVLPRSPQAPCHAPGVPAGGGMVGKTLRELSEGRNLHEVAAITENLNSHGVHPAHMEPLRAIFEGGKQYRMWWAQEAERALLPRLCTALGSDGGHVDAASYYDVFRKAGEELAMTDVLVAKVPGQHLNHRICQADMSVVYHAALTEEFDVFASLRDGGVVLINCPVLPPLQPLLPPPPPCSACRSTTFLASGSGIAERVSAGR
jgi:pyruvate/2-oxoacid:ferredoxin oxidoreductase alpha subunit